MFFRIFSFLGLLSALSAPLVAEAAQPGNTADALMQVIPRNQPQMQMSFAPIVRATAPSVVNIYAQRVVRDQGMANPFFNDPFFGQSGMNMFGAPRERIEKSLGSGVIVDPSGLIATNTHVIKGAKEITVATSDGREYPAEMLLTDDKSDLAILRLKDKAVVLPPLPLGDSDALHVGDLVLAIGNPVGVGQTVTSGIVSALARTGMGQTDFGYFIQTDAAINPGNSGGALVDMRGRVIGINSMIFSKDGGSLGIGFAIPVNMVKTVLRTAQSGGKKVLRAWTGFHGQPVTPDMLDSLGLKRLQGTLVNRVNPNGPAYKAGIRPGDVVLAINGYDVSDPEALKFRLATVELGTPVKLAVFHKGKVEVVEMLAAAPPEIPPSDQITLSGRTPISGAVVANISPAISEELGGTTQESGVVVMEAGLGNAARVGLAPGDIILSVNNEKISSVKQLLGELQTREAQRWLIQIMRGAQVLNLMITL